MLRSNLRGERVGEPAARVDLVLWAGRKPERERKRNSVSEKARCTYTERVQTKKRGNCVVLRRIAQTPKREWSRFSAPRRAGRWPVRRCRRA